MPKKLEIELIDISFAKHGWRTQEYGAIGTDRLCAERASAEAISLLAGDFALNERSRRVVGEVAELAGVPERELLHGPILDVLAHLIRRAQAGQRDLAALVHRLDGAGCRCNTHRGRRDDALQIGICLHKGQRIIKARLVIVVTIIAVSYTHLTLPTNREFVLHKADQGILIGR